MDDRTQPLFTNAESFMTYVAAQVQSNPVITAHNDQDDTWNVILDLGGYSSEDEAREHAAQLARTLEPLLVLAASAVAFGDDDPRAKWVRARRHLVVAEAEMFDHLSSSVERDTRHPRHLRAATDPAWR